MDIKFIEAMVSRICHDLISPISAVTNGTELVADLGAVDASDDAFDLIRDSAQAASSKLQLFRLAYGAGGAEWHVSIDDVEKTFGDYIALEKRCSLSWNVVKESLPQPLKKGLPKLVVLGLMWALESMPRGGSIDISAQSTGDEEAEFTIVASGEGAQLREGARAAFEGRVDTDIINPKMIHSVAVGHYAQGYDIHASVVEMDDKVTITIKG